MRTAGRVNAQKEAACLKDSLPVQKARHGPK